MPKVSFVMPTRNRLEWIGESISSNLAQTVEDIELVIVNDASDDGTKEFLDEWAAKFSRVKIIHNEQRMGGGRSRNIGMQAASSDIIATCDDDDLSCDTRAELIIKHFDLNPKSELVTFPYVSIGYCNEKLEEFDGEPFDHEGFLNGGNTYFSNPSSAVRKSSALELGGYEPETDDETDDIQFLRKWVKAGKKVDFQPGYFVNFHRVLPNSMMVKHRGWDPNWLKPK